MEDQIERFIAYLLDLGFIKTKSDIFIINRRFNLLIKQENEQNPELMNDKEKLNLFFIKITKSIMTDFFEERAGDVAAGIMDRYNEKQELEANRKKELYWIKVWNGLKTLERVEEKLDFRYIKHFFSHWRQAFRLTDKAKFQTEIDEEKERRIIAESSLTALQIDLKEAIEQIEQYENKERKRLEKKKRKIMQKRQEHLSQEVSRSLTVEETPLKVEKVTDESDKPKLVVRKTYHVDQRGSVNTEMRQRRLQSRLLTHRGSVASCSVYSRARSEFSFHPTINYNSKWRPKYDDHHDHKKMWKRMHAENEKIIMKKRLMSEQK